MIHVFFTQMNLNIIKLNPLDPSTSLVFVDAFVGFRITRCMWLFCWSRHSDEIPEGAIRTREAKEWRRFQDCGSLNGSMIQRFCTGYIGYICRWSRHVNCVASLFCAWCSIWLKLVAFHCGSGTFPTFHVARLHNCHVIFKKTGCCGVGWSIS